MRPILSRGVCWPSRDYVRHARLPGLALLFLLLPWLPLAAQQQQPAARPQPAAGPSAVPPERDSPPPAEAFTGTTTEDLEFIEGLLEEGDASEQGSFVYDAGSRRDPFVSLLIIADQVDTPRGPRPEGIGGLLIDELTLTGIWVYRDGPVAQFQPAGDPKSVLLREGDRLYDGEVVRITFDREKGGQVLFRQISNDPNLAKPFKEITKSLQP